MQLRCEQEPSSINMHPQWKDDKPVLSLNLNPRILSAASKAGLSTLSSVLILSVGDLSRRMRLSKADALTLVSESSKAVLDNQVHMTALRMYSDNIEETNLGRLSTGCPAIDSFLHGGLLVPGLNEVAGTSAAGKTQLCLQLCLSVQLPKTQGAVYLCTEDIFPHKRLHQLMESFSSKHGLAARKLSDNVFIEHAATFSSLSVQLQFKLRSLLVKRNVKLVVIDSIAALFRAEFSEAEAVQRAQLLRSFGAELRRLSTDFGAAIVCVNQVTAAIDSETQSSVKPALGLAWSEVVTMRLMLVRLETVDSDQDYQKTIQPVLREMEVLFAPHLPHSVTQYYIDQHGLHGVGLTQTRH